MLAKSLCLWAALASITVADTQTSKEGLQWQTDLETAQRMARETNRLVLIHFGGPWCEPCQNLEKQVFSRPGFGQELQASYVAVKVDPRTNTDLAAKYAVHTVPMDVVITASGQLVCKAKSPMTAAAYVESMQRIAASVQPKGETANAAAISPHTTTAAPHDHAPPSANDPADRYADYYRSRHPAASGRPEAPARSDTTMAQDARTTAVSMRQPTALGTTSADVRPPVTQPQPKVINPSAQASSSPAKLQGHPPEALDGFCAVSLVEKREWRKGDKRWGAIHRGRTYLFASEEAQQAFLAKPDHYSPVLSGNDPVMRLDFNRDVPGNRTHGAFYNDRIYLFVSEETFRRFESNPARYTVDARQALRR